MTKLRKQLMLLFAASFIFSIGCRKNDKPPSVPVLATAAITNMTSNSATSGGTISGNGGSEITVGGVCWSNENEIPTISDDTTQIAVKSGSFISHMSNLTSSVKYYVRAYAINGVGVGYGEVQTFTTGNAAPVARDVTITGTVQVNRILTAAYTYEDAENDAQSESVFQWYKATTSSGDEETPIDGATASTYTLQPSDEFAYIRVGIVPKASAGTTTGEEVKSAFTIAVAEAVDVTFTYNSQTVTYGIITSAVTGRKWMDRNLGAANAPSAFDDYANLGDLFQWGRGDDGHQLVIRDATNVESSAVNGPPSSTLSNSDVPGNRFIVSSEEPFDWRNPQNNNLWQGSGGVNNPCPVGWHIPTREEWAAEQLTVNKANNYTQLKLTHTGYRTPEAGDFLLATRFCFYWTSTVNGSMSDILQISSSALSIYEDYRGRGFACKCIKDQN